MKLKVNREMRKKIDAMRLSLSDVLDVFNQERIVSGGCTGGCAAICVGSCQATCEYSCVNTNVIPVI